MSKSKAENPFDLQETLKSNKTDNDVSPKSLSKAMESLTKPAIGLGGFGAASKAMESLTKPAIGLGGFGAGSKAMESLTKPAIGLGGFGAGSAGETLASLNKTSTKNIHKTANALVKSGKRPTLAAIRDEIGSGSFTTISEAMKSWREEQEELEQTLATKLPKDLEVKLQALGVNIWETANTLANECLNKDYKALEVMQSNVIDKLAQAEEIIKRLEEEKDQSNAELDRLRIENEKSRTELSKYKTAQSSTNEELKKAHKKIDEQGDQIKKLLDQQQELINTLTRFSRQ